LVPLIFIDKLFISVYNISAYDSLIDLLHLLHGTAELPYGWKYSFNH